MVPSGEAGKKLETWKEIAAHLGRDVRTVQRWEKREGLPVHRHMHDAIGTIYAYPDELDAWLQNRSKQPSDPEREMDTAPHKARRVWWYWAAPGLAATLALFAILGSSKGRGKAVARQSSTYSAPRVLAALSEPHRIRRVALPSAPGLSALSPDGSLLFVALWERGLVAVIHLASAGLVKEIRTGGQPVMPILSPDGRTLFVGDVIDGLHVVDLATEKHRVETTGGAVKDIVLSPDGRKLYLALGIHGLKRFDTESGVLSSIPAIVCPQTLDVSAATNTLWVSCRCGGPGGRPGHDNIDVLDIGTERSVRVLGGPPIVGGRIRISPDESQVWIDGDDACSSPRYDHQGCPKTPSGVLHAFRVSDGRLIKSLPVATQGTMTFMPDSKRLLFANGKTLFVFDAVAYRLTESMDVPGLYPIFSPIRPEFYLTAPKPNEILIVPLAPRDCQPNAAGLHALLSADGVPASLYTAGDAQLHEGVRYGSGMLGQGFHFDGQTGFLDFGLDGAYGMHLYPGKSGRLWMKPSRDGKEEVLLERLRANGSPHWRVARLADGRVHLWVFRLGQVAELISQDQVRSGEWSSITLVSGPQSLTLYLNGVAQGELRVSLDSDTPGSQARVGAGFRGGYFSGVLDEIAVWDRILTPAEVKTDNDAARRCRAAAW